MSILSKLWYVIVFSAHSWIVLESYTKAPINKLLIVSIFLTILLFLIVVAPANTHVDVTSAPLDLQLICRTSYNRGVHRAVTDGVARGRARFVRSKGDDEMMCFNYFFARLALGTLELIGICANKRGILGLCPSLSGPPSTGFERL